MLCSKLKQLLSTKSAFSNNVQFRCLITSRFAFKRWVWMHGFLSNLGKPDSGSMSPLRFMLKDFRVWSAWTRSNLVNNVVKRCKRERSVREMIQCFRQTFLRPRRTLLISATAAYKVNDDIDEDVPSRCDRNISDEDLQGLLRELEGVETLAKRTLFCASCGKRLVIDKKQPGVPYCACKVTETPDLSPDGWVPYMEAEDVVIWRKEYKPGLGLYAYKVYGRYSEVRASDFAAVQIDGAYRKVWDAAVAALAVVESTANGLPDQAVLHWEVLWPRLFANRDYVYIRRHKEFDVVGETLPHKDGLFQPPTPSANRVEPIYTERENVHSKAKRKAMELNEREQDGTTDNKVFVIISRSCEHPNVPETKHAIRVSEYWSHMVVKTLNGPDKCGMEFVLTYYDEPAVGGMPGSVAAWASGRAAPAYLQRMRRAASDYRAWRHNRTQQDLPDFVPFVSDPISREQTITVISQVSEEDMESSQSGPEIENAESGSRDQGTQTEASVAQESQEPQETAEPHLLKVDKAVETDRKEVKEKPPSSEGDCEKPDEEESNTGEIPKPSADTNPDRNPV